MRGVVMVLMAIDHVRVYSGLPAGGPTPGIFLTRWVTHFCAPAFVFLAGTAAFLHGRKLAGRGTLARYLVTRGLLLVVLELTIIRFAWTFNVDYSQFVLAGVIWLLGWCMVLLAGLVWLSTPVIAALGLAIIAFQNVFGLVPGAIPESVRPAFGRIWEFVYPAGLDSVPGVTVLYSIVPWIGVMAAGYAFGAIMVRDGADRRRLCLQIGVTATVAFLVAAVFTVVTQPANDGAPTAWIRVLNQRKYPASVLFLLMTLGPMIALVPFAERARSRVADVLATFGRVPMFYYLLHIPAIHIAALAVNLLREGTIDHARYATAPYASVPPEQRWNLALLYLVFAAVVALLYVPCRWYGNLKARRTNWWLRYIRPSTRLQPLPPDCGLTPGI
jgi:uncharacterized membrane protein